MHTISTRMIIFKYMSSQGNRFIECQYLCHKGKVNLRNLSDLLIFGMNKKQVGLIK